jgi:hypothetical protein
VDGWTRTSSRNTARPWTGSAQRGPWAVASWKAWEILSERECGVSDSEGVGVGYSSVAFSFKLENVS